MKLNKKAFAFQMLLIGSPCLATVDFQMASYQYSVSDLFLHDEAGALDHEKGIALEIQRTYNSRSLNVGRFGFGWCSDLDVRLRDPSGPDPNIEICGRRESWSSKKFGKVYKFDSLGRIERIEKKGGEFLQIFYGIDGKITEIGTRSGVRYKVELDSVYGFIEKIKGPQGQFDYTYLNENLVFTKKSGKIVERYQYDFQQNLIEILFQNGKREVIKYNSYNDTVSMVFRTDGCQEFYLFLEFPQNQSALYEKSKSAIGLKARSQTKAGLKCQGRWVKAVVHDFWYQRDGSGEYNLIRTQLKTVTPESF